MEIEYRGYKATLEYNEKTNEYDGYIYGTDRMVTFRGKTETKAKAEFKKLVKNNIEWKKQKSQFYHTK